MARKGNKDRGLYPKGKGWGACWTDATGALKRKAGFRTKTDAQAYLDKQRALAYEEKLFPERAEARRQREQMPTISEAMATYLELWKQKRSWEDEARFVRVWCAELGPDRKVDSVKPADVESYRLRRLAEGIAPATVNRATQFLGRLYKLLIRDEWPVRNPVAPLGKLAENNIRVRWLTTEEEARLRAALLPWQWRMVELALLTGLRLREQLGAKGLRREWVYPTHITIPTPKGGQARHVPLNRRARELVTELLAEHDGPYLFPGRAGGSRARPYFSGEAAQKFLALACSDGSQAKPRSKYTSASRVRTADRYANIPDFHWHDLRHTFCSRLVMAGVPLYWVRDLAGHKSITVTERYAHLAPGHLRQAVELLSPQEAVELLEGTGLPDRHPEAPTSGPPGAGAESSSQISHCTSTAPSAPAGPAGA